MATAKRKWTRAQRKKFETTIYTRRAVTTAPKGNGHQSLTGLVRHLKSKRQEHLKKAEALAKVIDVVLQEA